ncbi:MAG: hypothetical protein Q4C12_08470, partial [Clostridia bacterium]|nr:hypothetical protein [Clostridia bacterium]
AEIEVNGELAATLDETSAMSYALGELAADTAVVIKVAETVIVVDPVVSLTASSTDGAVAQDGTGVLRFITLVGVPQGESVEYYGTYIIPVKIFDGETGDDSTKVEVRKTGNIADGQTYSADLTNIPATNSDVLMYAWSFAKLQNYDAVTVVPFAATNVDAYTGEGE